MPTISKIEQHRVNRLEPVVHHVYDRGNGRRLPTDPIKLAKIPMQASTNGIATHQIALEHVNKVYSNMGWTSGGITTPTPITIHTVDASIVGRAGGPSKYLPTVKTIDATAALTLPATDALIIHMRTAKDVGRGNGSKAIFYQGKFYFIIIWSDLFGLAIKENELRVHSSIERILYLREADAQQTALLKAALGI